MSIQSYQDKELARIRTGGDEPASERVREAIRDVVAHSIYGLDKNPLAVELCRVALWLEAHCEGKPLTFLDHRIRCGDSLVGVFDLAVMESENEDGVPGYLILASTENDWSEDLIAEEWRQANGRLKPTWKNRIPKPLWVLPDGTYFTGPRPDAHKMWWQENEFYLCEEKW
jgi:hypothetical protein